MAIDTDQKRIAEGVLDPNRLVRGTMALALGNVSDEMPVDELIQMARYDADGRVREAVAEALTLIGGDCSQRPPPAAAVDRCVGCGSGAE
ncbi:MAG TPA: HEAT repeat domain-containing protein [Isosphaeraceae bacterium]|nr:HEAT repeat domain-containing protein [Isosphaeraceae bacterium]